jgi:hypothetical protein
MNETIIGIYDATDERTGAVLGPLVSIEYLCSHLKKRGILLCTN